MNKRIQELAEQAEAHYRANVLGASMYKTPPIKLMEKFAELIVRECVQVAVEQKQWVEKQQPVFNYDDDKWDRARIQQSQHIVDKIREHFGVEE